MKTIFSLATLVIALGIAVVLAKKQLVAVSAPPVSPGATAAGAANSLPPAQQVQQVQQQVQGLMQQARPASEP